MNKNVSYADSETRPPGPLKIGTEFPRSFSLEPRSRFSKTRLRKNINVLKAAQKRPFF